MTVKGIKIGFFLIILILITGCTQPASQKTDITPVPALVTTYLDQKIPSTQPAAPPSSPATEVLERGTADPDFIVDIAVVENIWPGTTILTDNHDPVHPRIIEVNRLGEIVWEYSLPDELKSYTNPGWDVEILQNGNILTLLPRYGVFEITKDKQVVWKYLDSRMSHDADRLKNGNTLIAFGAYDTADDAQVKEVDPAGKRVWSWYAKDVFTSPEYASISSEGWTHTNAVTRLDNGNTLISLRNFNFIAEVDHQGKLVRKIGEGLLRAQHDPLVLSDGSILVANHDRPHEILEFDPDGVIFWRFKITEPTSFPVRDANRLQNGNTLITEADRIIEVTPDKQIVWQFRFATSPFTDQQSYASKGLYKAERIPG